MSQQSNSFTYPAAWAAFRNPLSRGMTPRTLQWARDVGLVGDHNDVLERMGRSFNPESYAGWLYPSTRDVRALRILCDFVLWATALDDELERAGPACSDDGRQELLLSCAALLRGAAPGSPALQKYVAGFRDLSARLDEVVDPSYLPSWRARLLARMADNHASVVSQEHRAYRDWQDLEFYAAVRPDSSGLIPYLTFIEVMEGCPLSPAAADDPRLSRLHQLTALIFGLFNDVMSLDKERTGGPAFNAVLIVERAQACGEAEAVARVIAWHNALVGEFERGSRELCDAYGAEEPAVVRYLQGVQSAIVGIAEWQLGAPRYSEAAKRRARLTTSGAGGRAFASSLCVDPASETALRRFQAAFGAIRGFLRDDLAAYVSPERVTDIDRMIDYTCGGGKLLRGMLVVEAASLLVDAGDPDREVVVAQAQILGWCAELLQAYFLVIDDILDESELRRGKPCWHRVPSVGPTNAICDGMLLRSFVYRALERWFLDSAHYVEFVGLFNLCTYATELGQAVDTDGVRAHHVSHFDMRRFQQIARNKTAYYTYVLPLELALGVTGCLKRCDRALLRRLCALMGEFYQAQNDMLDFHSDARTTGKEGTDIAENKPTWLVATAMERARPEQWAVIAENYGRRDAPCVAAVHAVYEALDVRRLFAAYARATEAAVRAMIAGLAQESPVVGRVCDLAWDKTRLAGVSLLEVADPP